VGSVPAQPADPAASMARRASSPQFDRGHTALLRPRRHRIAGERASKAEACRSPRAPSARITPVFDSPGASARPPVALGRRWPRMPCRAMRADARGPSPPGVKPARARFLGAGLPELAASPVLGVARRGRRLKEPDELGLDGAEVIGPAARISASMRPARRAAGRACSWEPPCKDLRRTGRRSSSQGQGGHHDQTTRVAGRSCSHLLRLVLGARKRSFGPRPRRASQPPSLLTSAMGQQGTCEEPRGAGIVDDGFPHRSSGSFARSRWQSC